MRGSGDNPLINNRYRPEHDLENCSSEFLRCGGAYEVRPKEADELEFEDVDETERKLDFELVFKERETVVYLVKGLSDPERGIWWALDLLVQAMNVARVAQHEVKNGVTAKEVAQARLSGQ